VNEPVTALVCTRDRPHLLDDCLASIAAAMHGGDELIVVAFGDGSAADLVAGLAVEATFIEAERGGKSRQLNTGLRAARHEIVVMTDDDCRVDESWLAAMAGPFADPRVGAVFGTVAGLSGVRGAANDVVPAGAPPPVTWQYANGAAMAVRRAAMFAIGGFDERLGPGAPLHGEEHDVVLRLMEAGWDIRIADAPVVEHLEWRTDEETRRNLLVYSRGAGAFLGAALRRSPRRWMRLTARRLRYQLLLWRHRAHEGLWFGPATTWAFIRGLCRGLLLGPRRYL
jgi:GT2 family glycosyltransferase